MKNNIMKKTICFALTACFLSFTACQSPEVLISDNPTAGADKIWATLPDGKGEFFVENPHPYKDGDVLTVVIPWYYPEESTQETDMTQMKLYASLPNNVKIEPGLGKLIDLSQDQRLTVTSPNGAKSTLIIKAERRRSDKKMITDFSLSNGLSGIILEDKKMVGLVAGGQDLANLTPNIKVSPHASISPDPTLPQDFNNPVTYTITAHDGSSQQYTVQTFMPNKIARGLRKASAKQLFSVKLTDLGVGRLDWAYAIAISDKYVYLNTRNEDLIYIDRFTGKKVGTIELPFKSGLGNFFVTNDDKGTVLLSNLNQDAGKPLNIYRINGTGAPEVYIEYKGEHAKGAGRRMSIVGSLDGDALILVSIQQSSKFIYWKVTGGVLQSPEPQLYTADVSKIKWNFVSDAAPLDKQDLSKGLFLAGYGPVNAVGLFNGDGSLNAALNLEALGIEKDVNQSFDLVDFNGANYLAMASHVTGKHTLAYLFDVTSPASIGGDPKSPEFLIYKSPELSAPNNAGSIADVHLKVSPDGLKMILYLLGSAGGVDAYEFDCIDVDNL